MTTEDAIAKLEVYEPKPGDVVVIECQRHLSGEQLKRMADAANVIFQGKDVRVLILDSGDRVKVVRSGSVIPSGWR